MKLIRKHNELNLLKESDDFDWIKGIDISDYLEPPYFKNMVEIYGLSPDDYEITLSKVFNQPVTIKDNVIYNNENKIIYNENHRGDWEKYEYDADGNQTHYEDVNGFWYKKEYDGRGNNTYYENANGFWLKKEYDNQNKRIYFEDSNGNIIDNRHLNESDEMDWIRDVDINPPYFKNMKEYGSSPDEYDSILSRVFNQPVSIDDGFQKRVYNNRGFEIYHEDNDGDWEKWEYDADGNEIYGETSYGYWYKKEYDGQGNLIYYEHSSGYWYKKEYDGQGNQIYFEDSYGNIIDNRNLNESDDFDWIRDVDSNISFYDVRVNEKYNVELTDEFYKALNQCFGELEPYELMGYQRTTNVLVIDRRMMKHKDVYCHSDNNNEVISLHLEFYNDNGTNIADHFWVTEEMANLFPRDTSLNESDEMDWIRDVDITNHMEPPYFKNMKEYGLKPNEYESILSKIFNQPVKYGVTVQGYIVYDKQDNRIYSETSGGWVKREYDGQGNITYYEHSNGYWVKYEYDGQGNRIYYQNSNGEIEDNRHLNESDDMDWIRDVEPHDYILTDEEWVKLNAKVSELMKKPGMRIGEAYMMALRNVNERIYNHVTGTNLDPWGGGVSYMKLLGFLRGEYYGIK